MKKKSGGGGDITDPRFAAVFRDPRFSRFPRKQTAVTIDDRFKGVLEDPDFQVTGTLNKHGRKVKKKGSNDDMRRFYHLPAADKSEDVRPDKPSKKARATKVADPPPARDDDDEDDDDAAPAETAILKSAAKLQRPQSKKAQRRSSGEMTVSPAKSAKRRFDSDEDADDAEDVADDDDDVAADGDVAEDSDSSDEDVDEEAQRRFDRMRGIGVGAESSSDDEGGAADDDDDGTAAALDEEELAFGTEKEVELDPAEWGIGAAAGNPDADTTLLTLSDATPRLAVVDMDWQRMRAVDILAVLRSFVPKGRSLHKVTVYVSDYGRDAMAREREEGPQGLRPETQDGEEGEPLEAEVQERVRMYERSKLRWYFAIATFDSAAAANAVYDECDGTEFEESSARFDLRFVPDSEDFSSREVRDEATDVPVTYEAPLFKSKALQHTKPTLTWDENDDSRKKVLHRKLAADEIKEDEFKAYLASDSEGDEEDEEHGDVEAIRKRYASLVSGAGSDRSAGRAPKSGDKSWNGDDQADEDGSDKREMQVTFASGLENLGKRILQKKAKAEARAGQTLFEQYLQRKKEKKAAQRAVGKVNVDSESDDDSDGGRDGGSGASSSGEEEEFFDDDGGGADASAGKAADAGFDDDFFKDDVEFDDEAQSDDDTAQPAVKRKADKRKRTSGQRSEEERAAQRQRQAELELLMLDDAQLAAAKDGVVAKELAPAVGDDAKKRLSRKQMIAAKKEQRKRAKDRRDSDDDEDVDANLEDPRFQAVVTNPEFAIDSTDPHFSRIKNAKKLLTNISARRKGLRHVKGEATVADPKSKGKTELAALVGNLKRRGPVGNQKNWG